MWPCISEDAPLSKLRTFHNENQAGIKEHLGQLWEIRAPRQWLTVPAVLPRKLATSGFFDFPGKTEEIQGVYDHVAWG